MEDFDTLSFEKRLGNLKDTQESIQSLSSWCLSKRNNHKKIVASWLNVLKRAKVEQRLTLFYLANDVIQYSKRKNYEFVESWGTTLQKATPLVRDDKIKHKILRIFRIWEERQIYNDEFLTDLTGLLSVTAGKQTPDMDPNDFQAVQLVNKIRQCAVLETDTDQQLKKIHESHLPLNDAENLCKMLKERRDPEEAKTDLDEGINKLEGYVNALQKELVARANLCRLLQKAHNHYATQRDEVKVVANAYKSFGNRVRLLKRKLDEMYNQLPDGASPVPSPPSFADAVPSPGPDEDLDLPSVNLDNAFLRNMEKDLSGKSFGTFVGKANFSYSSLRDNLDLSLSAEANKIEVIGTRGKSEEVSANIHSLLKTLIPNKPPPSNQDLYQPLLTPPPPPPPLLPGLDLLNPSDSIDGSNMLNRPPNNLNFYGTAIPNSNPQGITMGHDNFTVDNRQQWNNIWDGQRAITSDTPESPPIEPLRSPPPMIMPTAPPRVADVDHRQLLAPPPVMPQVLLKNDDIDHRRLPPLPTDTTQIPNDLNRNHKGDVDHRNLISLTMGGVPPPPAPPIVPWPQRMHADQDYRTPPKEFSNLLPPPLPPMSIPPPVRRLTSHSDNVESIDMEMSDEEVHEPQDEDFRNLRFLETSMARIHGHPPPSIQKSSYRQQDPPGHDKTFVNNNRMFRDGPQSDNHNNINQNDMSMSRTNLVHINSDSTKNNMENEQGHTDGFHGDGYNHGDQSAPINDIFSDFPSNAMNPINPNLHDSSGRQDLNMSHDSKNDDDWERSDEEGAGYEPWNKPPMPLMSAVVPNFQRGRPMFNRRQPAMHYRRPPPLLNTPPFKEETYFHPRGNNNFRRPRGPHRPPRGNYW